MWSAVRSKHLQQSQRQKKLLHHGRYFADNIAVQSFSQPRPAQTNQTRMKTSFSNKLFLYTAALAIAILGDTKTQAQPAVEAWVRSYNGVAESDDRAQKTALESPCGECVLSAHSPVAAGVSAAASGRSSESFRPRRCCYKYEIQNCHRDVGEPGRSLRQPRRNGNQLSS